MITVVLMIKISLILMVMSTMTIVITAELLHLLCHPRAHFRSHLAPTLLARYTFLHLLTDHLDFSRMQQLRLLPRHRSRRRALPRQVGDGQDARRRRGSPSGAIARLKRSR